MRGFIVLCLCAVSMAAPQGYNYNQGAVSVQQSGAGGFGGSFSGVATSATGGGAFFQGGQSIQQSGFGGHQQVQQQQQQHQQQQQAIVSKRFFIHSAPEDVEEDYKEKHITVGVPKKNYNVVFIKSPAKSNKKTAIKISPAPNEEKTVIYVLSKKTDASDIQAEVIEHATTTAKPEVFFIKYKTNEEANHAQEQIQAQYDALGGTSQVTDEGVAPVTSVIGSLGGGDAGAAAGSGFGAGTGTGTGVGAHVGGSASFGGVQTGSGSFGGVQTGAISGATNNNAYLPPNFY
ncbi:fibroin heavy chain [Calliphora vicina]|uniref:fibroin heavy chain n=1 Tax=Calliphora vicina TaxID=7373 RepID=UPI00325B6511